MKAQAMELERMVQTDEGLRLNPEYLQQIVRERREALELLAPHDDHRVPETDDPER